MSKNKNKNKNNLDSLYDKALEIAGSVGIVAMAAATIIGMAELTDRLDNRAVITQPAYAYAGIPDSPITDNSMRKEDVAHRPISYGITMRTEAVSGKR